MSSCGGWGHEGLACNCVCSCDDDGGDGQDGGDVFDGLSLNCGYDLNLNGINIREGTVRDCLGCATTLGLGSQICLIKSLQIIIRAYEYSNNNNK